MFIGEALIGDGDELAHVDLLIGEKDGPVGNAFANGLSQLSVGHTPLLSVIRPNLITKPATIIIPKVTVGDLDDASKIYGVASVVDEIHSENFHYYLESQEFTTEYVYDASNPSVIVNKPTLLKYILNFNNRRIELYKDKITVLDISNNYKAFKASKYKCLNMSFKEFLFLKALNFEDKLRIVLWKLRLFNFIKHKKRC